MESNHLFVPARLIRIIPFIISIFKHARHMQTLALHLAALWQVFIKDQNHPTGTHPIWDRMAGGFSAALDFDIFASFW